MATYYGAGCVYIVFIAESIHDVINFEFDLDWDVRVYIAIILVPVLLIGQVSKPFLYWFESLLIIISLNRFVN